MADRETREGTDDEPARELHRLQIQKLQREILELDAPPWKRPPWLAAVATITAALIGLVWAVTNGYFETKVRELKIQADEVQKARDLASRRFAAERDSYELNISRLKRELASLGERIGKIDVPVVSHGTLSYVPWDKEFVAANPSRTVPPELGLVGVNFGERPGEITVLIMIAATSASQPRNELTFKPKPILWEDDYIRATMPMLSRAELRVALLASARDMRVSPSQCTVVLVTNVYRSDGKVSHTSYIQIPEATPWLVAP